MRRLAGLLFFLSSLQTGLGQVVTGHITVGGTQSWHQVVPFIYPANYYVAPASGATTPCSNGSDSNTGTSVTTPFATIGKAQTAARSIVGTENVTILICGGTYYGTSLTFSSSDSGTASFPVLWANYPGQSPIISAGTRLTSWSTTSTGPCAGLTMPSGSSCWVTSYSGAFAEKLFYNGVFRYRPRFGATTANPWGAYAFSAGAVSTSPTCTSGVDCALNYVDPSGFTLANYTSIANGHVEMTTFNRWTSSIMNLKSVTPGSHLIVTTCTTSANCAPQINNNPPYQADMFLLIDNVKELFGCPAQATACPGQWYYDTPNNKIYYISNTGENPNSDTVEIGVNTQLFTGSGVQYITFQGLQFRDDNWTIPSTGFLSKQLDPNLTNALFTCDACNSITWQQDAFADTTGSAIQITGNSTGVQILNNLFYDIGAYPIRAGVSQQNTTGSSNSTVPRNMTIQNNYLYRVNTYLASADGIMVGIANNINILNNQIRYVTDKGLELCMPNSHTCSKGSATDNNIVASFNDIGHVGQGVLTDLAAIYISTETGTGNLLNNNRLYDVQSGLVQNSNEVDPGAHGIYIDDQTGLITVKNNLVYRIQNQLAHMNAGPQATSQQNVWSNNIFVNWSNLQAANAGCVGIQQPDTSVLSFSYSHNICSQSDSSLTLVNPQTGPPSSSSSSQQQFVENIYSLAGTPKFNISGVGTNVSFANWKGTYGEDTAGTISTSPGFLASTACPAPYDPQPGICDDFSFSNGVGPGFGFQVWNGTSGIQFTFGPTLTSPFIAPTIPAYFPEAVCQTTAGCSF